MTPRNTFSRLLRCSLLLALGSTLALLAAPAGDKIMGTWSPDLGKNSKIEIGKCGNLYCGVIVWMKLPRNDDKNVDARQRSSPLVSKKIMINFKFEQGAWVGELYSPETGKTAKAKFTMPNPKEIDINETVGGKLQKTGTWRRVAE